MRVMHVCLFFSLALSFACATTQQQRTADIILTGGKIYTGDPQKPWAQAVAIDGERILAVGDAAEIAMFRDSQTEWIELAGAVVIPGINDAHVHAPWISEPSTRVRLPRDGVTTESLLSAVRNAAEAPGQSVISAELPLSLVDAGITRNELDAISMTRPIRLTVFGGHSAILNTAALRAWGIAENATDPAGGWYGRTDGTLNGWVYEHAYWLPQQVVSRNVSIEEIRREITEFEDEAVKYGITSVQTMSTVPASRLEEVLRTMQPRLRWRVIDFRLAPFDGSGGAFPVKYILDGTPIERSAAMIAPYADAPSAAGRMNYTDEEIAAMVRDAAQGRRQLLVHAVGDRTIQSLLDAMQATPANWPALRVRIEHGDSLTPEQAAIARRLGVFVVQNPAHFMIPELLRSRLGDDRLRQAQPAASLISSGTNFAIGSDGPLNPFLNMMFASIHPANPGERLTVEQTLHAYTAGAAAAEMTEGEKGRIAPGMAADLAVLTQDIFSVPPDALPATASRLTMVGGRIVHRQ